MNYNDDKSQEIDDADSLKEAANFVVCSSLMQRMLSVNMAFLVIASTDVIKKE